MNDRLSIRVRVEVMTSALKLFAQLAEVVDLTVEHDPHAVVFVVNGLAAGDEVNNA